MTANRTSDASLPTMSPPARSSVLAIARCPAASDGVSVVSHRTPSRSRRRSAPVTARTANIALGTGIVAAPTSGRCAAWAGAGTAAPGLPRSAAMMSASSHR